MLHNQDKIRLLMGGLWQVAASPSILCASNTICKEFAVAAWKQRQKKNDFTKTKTKTIGIKVCATIFVLFYVAVLWPVSVGVALVHWNVPVLSCCHWYRCYTGFEPRKQTATNGSKLIGLLMNINKVQLIDFTDICTYIAGYVSTFPHACKL